MALELKNKDLEARLADYVNDDALNAKINAMRDSVRQELLATFQASMSTVSQSVLVSVTAVQTDIIARTNSIQEKISGIETTVLGKALDLISDAVDRSEDRTNLKVTNLETYVTNVTITLSDTLNAAVASTRAQLETKINTSSQNSLTAIADVSGKLTTTQTDVAGLKTSVADAANVKMWSGYCTNSGRSNPTDYCLNKEEWNTADKYLRVDNGYQFVALEDGVFRLNFFCSTFLYMFISLFLVESFLRHRADSDPPCPPCQSRTVAGRTSMCLSTVCCATTATVRAVLCCVVLCCVVLCCVCVVL